MGQAVSVRKKVGGTNGLRCDPQHWPCNPSTAAHEAETTPFRRFAVQLYVWMNCKCSFQFKEMITNKVFIDYKSIMKLYFSGGSQSWCSQSWMGFSIRCHPARAALMRITEGKRQEICCVWHICFSLTHKRIINSDSHWNINVKLKRRPSAVSTPTQCLLAHSQSVWREQETSLKLLCASSESMNENCKR